MQNLAFKFRYMMSTTANVFAKYNQFREIARFESQNITWAVEELETHGNAVARGFKSLGINKGDTILMRVPQNLQTEIVATQFGAHKLGAKLQRSTATNDQEVVQELQRYSASGFIFDPAHLGDQFNKSLNLNNFTNGSKFKVDKFPKLKFLVQTGPYSMRGVYKFKNVLNYATDTYSPVTFQQLKADDIQASTDPIIVTDVFSAYGFKAGLLNALYNNRFVIYADSNPQNFNILTANIPKAFVIGDQISELPSSYTKLNASLPRNNQNKPKKQKKPAKSDASTQTNN